MPFPNGTFDFVICTSAFKNFPEPVKVLDEVFRVSKTNGKALIIDMRKDVSKAKLNEFVNHMKLNMFDSFLTKRTFRSLAKSAYTKGEIQDIVKKSRFKRCEIIEEDIGLEIWLKRKPKQN